MGKAARAKRQMFLVPIAVVGKEIRLYSTTGSVKDTHQTPGNCCQLFTATKSIIETLWFSLFSKNSHILNVSKMMVSCIKIVLRDFVRSTLLTCRFYITYLRSNLDRVSANHWTHRSTVKYHLHTQVPYSTEIQRTHQPNYISSCNRVNA